MASTRTSGITVNAYGERIINKAHYGVRLFLRLGRVSQAYAEERLWKEIANLDIERERKDRSRPLFRDYSARYLAQSRHMRSIEVIKWHVRLLIAQVGDLEPHKVHDGTLEPFVTSRLASGTGPTTINRTYKSNAVRTMNNTAWQKARRAIDLPSVRVHDLRHTYGARLRAAGVSHEDRAALLV